MCPMRTSVSTVECFRFRGLNALRLRESCCEAALDYARLPCAGLSDSPPGNGDGVVHAVVSEIMEITQAYWLRPHLGVVLLKRNWTGAEPPRLLLDAETLPSARTRAAGAGVTSAHRGS